MPPAPISLDPRRMIPNLQSEQGECSLFKDDGTLSGKMGTLVPIPCMEDIIIESAGAAHAAAATAAEREAATIVAKCFQCIPRWPSGGTVSESRGTVGRIGSRNNSRGGSADYSHPLDSGDAHVKKAFLKSREVASARRHRSRPHPSFNVGTHERSGLAAGGGGGKDKSEFTLALPSEGNFPLSVSAEPSHDRPVSRKGGDEGAGAAFATGVAAALVGIMLSSAASSGSADEAGATDRAVAGCNKNCGGGTAVDFDNESDGGSAGSGSGRARGPGDLRESSGPGLRGAQVEKHAGGLGREGAVEGGAERSQTLEGRKNARDGSSGNSRGGPPKKAVYNVPPRSRSRDESQVHVPERHVGPGAEVDARGADGRTVARDDIGAKKSFVKRGIGPPGVGGAVSAARASGDESHVVVSEFYTVHPLSGKEYEAAFAERELQVTTTSATVVRCVPLLGGIVESGRHD